MTAICISGAVKANLSEKMKKIIGKEFYTLESNCDNHQNPNESNKNIPKIKIKLLSNQNLFSYLVEKL